MTKTFDGKNLRDEIISTLAQKVAVLKKKPNLAVIWIGDNPVSAKYVEHKMKTAKKIGVQFDLIKLQEAVEEEVVLEKIKQLNNDKNVDGIMVQLPIPENLNRGKIISAISKEKDIDGLRFCQNLNSNYYPPVVLAIIEAVKNSGTDYKVKKIALVGQGFLVGAPLAKYLKDVDIRIADENTPDVGTITSDADIVISADGKPGLIKANMIKKGVVLVDAGTTEVGGKLTGDINPECYSKASCYTPVPGGIGPVTIAMLFKNLLVKI